MPKYRNPARRTRCGLKMLRPSKKMCSACQLAKLGEIDRQELRPVGSDDHRIDAARRFQRIAQGADLGFVRDGADHRVIHADERAALHKPTCDVQAWRVSQVVGSGLEGESENAHPPRRGASSSVGAARPRRAGVDRY